MSYEVLESVRATLVENLDDHLPEDLIAEGVSGRIYPEDTQLKQRLEGGQLPLVTFVMQSENIDACGRISGVVRLDVVHRELAKKILWDVHRAMQKVLNPLNLQAQADAETLDVRFGLFRQQSESDDVFDQLTNTYRLRSTWAVKCVRRTTSAT